MHKQPLLKLRSLATGCVYIDAQEQGCFYCAFGHFMSNHAWIEQFECKVKTPLV